MEQLYKDALHAAPNVTKLLMENDRVRVFDVRFKPGEKTPMHSHPDHVMYAFNDGKLRLTPANGKTKEVAVKAGQAVWMDATSHTAENPGKNDLHFVAVELKE
jgi:quercetin dioxygenase-like cupin family protein